MTVSRRTFVRGSLAAGTVAGTGLIQIGCGNDVEPAPFVNATDTVFRDQLVMKDILRYADLKPIGGAIMIRLLRSDVALGYPENILVVHRADPPDPLPYMAMNGSCPHQGCPLGYSQKSRLVECPCHSSRFSATYTTGTVADLKVVHRPAVQAPVAYATAFNGADLTIDVNCPPSTFVVSLAAHPELMQVGGMALVKPPEAPCQVLLSRKDSATVVALNARCTHLGCAVEVLGGKFDCPCHGSQFDLDGNVVLGPAMDPLEKFTVAFDGTTITITT
jgi:cytochrome b6-f complex iron-sulfur subunit